MYKFINLFIILLISSCSNVSKRDNYFANETIFNYLIENEVDLQSEKDVSDEVLCFFSFSPDYVVNLINQPEKYFQEEIYDNDYRYFDLLTESAVKNLLGGINNETRPDQDRLAYGLKELNQIAERWKNEVLNRNIVNNCKRSLVISFSTALNNYSPKEADGISFKNEYSKKLQNFFASLEKKFNTNTGNKIHLGDGWYVSLNNKIGKGTKSSGIPTIDWHINYQVDEITDKKVITMFKAYYYRPDVDGEKYRYFWPPFHSEDNRIQQKLSFQVTRFMYQNEVRDKICILGHDYPDRTAYLRIDKNKAIEFSDTRKCILIDGEIKNQLETGKEVIIRGSPFPDTNITTYPKSLLGYSKVKAFIDFWYATGKPLEYNYLKTILDN